MDIEANLRKYIDGGSQSGGIKPGERYASFDYCFNYFQRFREEKDFARLASPEQIQESCYQLGYFLASWGMLRGAAFLLDKSVRVYIPVIRAIASADPGLWEIDADSYTSANIRLIMDFRRAVVAAFAPAGNASDILVTKIMLGVFGNVPAFDQFFRKGLGVATFGQHALRMIGEFYAANSAVIEKYRRPTVEFSTGQPTSRKYSRAKVIDMIFFIEGGGQ